MSVSNHPICGIYKITNLVNGKCYIGQSKNIPNRKKSHKCNASGNHNDYLRRAINKYGFDNFLFEVIEECEAINLDKLEKKYITQCNSLVPNGYNMDLGGYIHKIMGEETRKKRRLASLGEKNPNYGKPKSEAFKRIVFIALSKPINQYSRDGKFIKSYPNARSVEDFPKGNRNISLCCNGKTKSAYGYQWRFAECGSGNIESIASDRIANNTPISQFTLDGSLVATYPNMRIASDVTGIEYRSISMVCKGRRNKTGGFAWRYASDNN